MILATGSVALPIPGVEFGGRVLDTWGAWSLPELPESIAVVGAGASGSEIASAYARFGTEVMLIEMLDQILPAEDKDMARVVERSFKKQGIEVVTGARVENVEAGSDSVKFTYGDESQEVDYLVIAGGRGADVEALGLDEAGLELDEDGKIEVDDSQKTSDRRRLRDRRPHARPGARPQGAGGGHRRGRDDRRPGDPPDRPRRDPRRHLLPSPGRQRRPHRGGGQGGRARRQDRQVQARRRRRRRRLRRPRRHGQARRRLQVRRDPRRPHRRQPRLRHDRRAGRDNGARGRLPGAGRGSSIRTRRSPRRSSRPPARRRWAIHA